MFEVDVAALRLRYFPYVRLVWIAVAAAPAACLFPDLGDLGSPDAASDSCAACAACADGGDAAPTDASDAQPPVDAADAGGDATGSGYCATLGGTHALCEDFDEGSYSAQFTNVHTTQFGSLAADSTESVSAPLSLLANIQSRPTGSDQAFMTRLFTGTASAATYSFDVRFDSWTTGGKSGVFAAIVVNDGQPSFHVLSIYTTDTYGALEESFFLPDGGTAYIDHTLATTVQLGAWSRVSFSVDLVGKTCSATLDGNTVVSAASLDPSWAPGPIAVDLGLSYVASEKTAWQTRYDDVVFDFQ
jgi:hypothetical protein